MPVPVDDLPDHLKVPESDLSDNQKVPEGDLPGASALSNARQMTTLERFGTGVKDPIEGGAQLMSHAVPGSVSKYMDEFNNWLADKGGPLEKLPPGGMDEAVRQREKKITAETPNPDRVETTLDAQGRASHVNVGPDKGSDPVRMIGQMMSPANYAP